MMHDIFNNCTYGHELKARASSEVIMLFVLWSFIKLIEIPEGYFKARFEIIEGGLLANFLRQKY